MSEDGPDTRPLEERMAAHRPLLDILRAELREARELWAPIAHRFAMEDQPPEKLAVWNAEDRLRKALYSIERGYPPAPYTPPAGGPDPRRITDEQIDAAIKRAGLSTRAALHLYEIKRAPRWRRLWEWIRP